jgi:hypothetical protein
VDKNTSRGSKPENSEGYSGSTAWHNSVRSRIFMFAENDGKRTLLHQKSNHGTMHEFMSLDWPKDELPKLAVGSASERSLNGHSDDKNAAELLKLIDEYAGRQQYFSSSPSARNNAYAMLRSDPAFLLLKLKSDDIKRILTQCHRQNWLQIEHFRADSKDRQRWAVTTAGLAFAGVLPPTPPRPLTSTVGEPGGSGATPPPTSLGGVGESGGEKTGTNESLS